MAALGWILVGVVLTIAVAYISFAGWVIYALSVASSHSESRPGTAKPSPESEPAPSDYPSTPATARDDETSERVQFAADYRAAEIAKASEEDTP